MTVTRANLAARLLRDAAQFFETIGEETRPLREQMNGKRQFPPK